MLEWNIYIFSTYRLQITVTVVARESMQTKFVFFNSKLIFVFEFKIIEVFKWNPHIYSQTEWHVFVTILFFIFLFLLAQSCFFSLLCVNRLVFLSMIFEYWYKPNPQVNSKVDRETKQCFCLIKEHIYMYKLTFNYWSHHIKSLSENVNIFFI